MALNADTFTTIMAEVMASGNKVSLESNETTRSNETEIIVYCRIQDFDGLQKASKIETHEQLETEFKNGVRCRVRRTSKSPVVATEDSNTVDMHDDSYEFTFKLKDQSEGGFESNQEFTVNVDKDFFDGFRQIADHRLLKTRYEFSSDKIYLNYQDGDEKKTMMIPNIKYEIDVYLDKDGQICEWCKIDIEVDAILDHIAKHHPDIDNLKMNVKISHLPFEPSDGILTLSASEEQKAFVDSLWKDHYRLSPTEAITSPTEATAAPEVE